MVRLTVHIRLALLLAVLLLASVALPYAAHAQESTDDLRSAIQSELASDPRTSGFSQTQLDAIVDVLVEEALKNSLTPGDITWRPQDADSFVVLNSPSDGAMTTSSVCDSAGLPCLFNEAFGLVGPDTTIPFVLGASSMGLIWIFAEMLHKRRMRVQSDTSTSM